jgi:hypothetical protein
VNVCDWDGAIMFRQCAWGTRNALVAGLDNSWPVYRSYDHNLDTEWWCVAATCVAAKTTMQPYPSLYVDHHDACIELGICVASLGFICVPGDWCAGRALQRTAPPARYHCSALSPVASMFV